MKTIVFRFFLSVAVLINIFSLYPEAKTCGGEYYFKRNESNKIALTFDDGPHPVYTKKILDVLDKYNVKATFFIVGQNAGYYKDALKDIVKNGHELGNHTFTHATIKGQSAANIMSEIEDCRNAIYDICGENTVLFRPPGGLMAEVSAEDAELFENYDIIFWSIDTMDWAMRSPAEIAEYVLDNTKSGDIILMHDYIGKNSPTPAALELMIPKLIEKGYEFVTVSELISSK